MSKSDIFIDQLFIFTLKNAISPQILIIVDNLIKKTNNATLLIMVDFFRNPHQTCSDVVSANLGVTDSQGSWHLCLLIESYVCRCKNSIYNYVSCDISCEKLPNNVIVYEVSCFHYTSQSIIPKGFSARRETATAMSQTLMHHPQPMSDDGADLWEANRQASAATSRRTLPSPVVAIIVQHDAATQRLHCRRISEQYEPLTLLIGNCAVRHILFGTQNTLWYTIATSLQPLHNNIINPCSFISGGTDFQCLSHVFGAERETWSATHFTPALQHKLRAQPDEPNDNLLHTD